MFADPSRNVAYFGLTEGDSVADFGAGSGAYSLALARRVGNSGYVYAVEVQNDLLTRLDREALQQGLRNIHVVWGNVEKVGGSKLADGSIDAVLISNILFQAEARYSLALEAKRVLKPGGRAIVIDWLGSFGGLGPHPNQVILPDEVKKIFAEAGFEFVRDFPAGEHHYGLIFRKP